ncbi:hypothetical protein PILCRDRAFT_227592 [Piloderma croceum F 1598]|uniref:Zn(2)-C6 fungal-type domain-containing protein n=1 Tax=Piloderma croceum (strain F 1598) TaxID=765440 RepID=A0A0C3FZ03_PILCF|nr:hypothetical protein PILCRDRAFT_227592 [Piloderma croceum F 1598]
MTHAVLPKSEPSPTSPSLPNTLQMDPQQSQHAVPHPPAQPARKRKKNDINDEPAEPRRLRRSHEACARCRSKKIKCDSKHPRCTACANAGTPCHQEDRHRQTLTPRGYTERLERQLKQCEVLLQQHIQGFDLNNLDELCAREGIHIADPESPSVSAAFQFAPQIPPQSPQGYPYSPISHMGHPSYPVMPPPSRIHTRPIPSLTPPVEIKGQDPQSNDMSNTQALAKNFGVDSSILSNISTTMHDNEDLAVGSGGLTSGRDRLINEANLPRDSTRWISVNLPRNRVESTTFRLPQHSVKIWLPKDRQTVKHIINVYFTRLNFNRPALDKADFERDLNALYDGEITSHHDQGFICMLYLVLALGTLNEVNHRANKADNTTTSPNAGKRLMPEGWPEHGEFFEWGLFYKPEIQATISALQALILLHWYLYTERQGRSLWRLVGGLVRLAVELGLHHDPFSQGIFTDAECQLRIRLWGIVMVHDRGTSILLGRPLGIAPYDSNTPHPSRPKNGQLSDCSEHFVLSHEIAEMQADIINSLYTPTSQSPDTIMRHATRIVKSMVEFTRQLPEKYHKYFKGSEDLPLDQRSKLVEQISEDEGLTLLKIGISRILLLRVLFNSEALVMPQRQKALLDAVVTAHNIIIIHNHLIRFPDIGFFVSPIPLHIAAMVILYGHINKSMRLRKSMVIQDIWMALDVLPRMRWRWQRKDINGEHPLIANLAERVLEINLRDVVPSGDQMLLSELDWDSNASLMSPSMAVHKQEQMTPVIANAQFPSHGTNYGQSIRGSAPSNGHGNGMINNHQLDNKQPLMEVPSGLFYPFFPERKLVPNRNDHSQDFSEMLAVAGAQAGGPYGHDSYIGEDDVQMWMPQNGQRGALYPVSPT